MKKNLKKMLSRKWELPFALHFDRVRKSFTPAEKLLFAVCAVLLILGSGMLLLQANNLFVIERPAHGGRLIEGVVGVPRFVNPLLALSDADRDLSSLIYSGLLKATPEGGLVPDLAESYSVSDNGLSYTFTLRKNARFHDGTPVTADDVIFTVQKAQDPALKSPKRANWEGVAAEKINDKEVRLTLKQPYSPFLENATLGILPKHIWKEVDTEQFAFSTYNINAVGSGPYKISDIKRNDAGTPDFYELASFKTYALGAPFVRTFIFRFYPAERDLIAALKRGEVESASGITPESALTAGSSGKRVIETPLPRVFGVFFNQNQAPVLAEKDVRSALNLAVNKEELVEKVLLGFGLPLEGPVPPFLLDGIDSTTKEYSERLAEANLLLDKAGWKRNASGIREKKKGKQIVLLSFTLTTSSVPALKKTAELLAQQWKEIGASAEVQIYESGDLNQNIIRPRKYDALLFGEIIGREVDLFAFWHSSQRNDPGLNIAMYTNSKVDRLLEDARRSGDRENRLEQYRSAVSAIAADVPAVFLYSPKFIYVIPDTLQGVKIERAAVPSERFLSVHTWYTHTQKIWEFLVPTTIYNK
ncbi:MAG: ABC transporter substrate-binding protein [bacterium]|nr:ABC transporter substrate-binding protein [bacterium]